MHSRPHGSFLILTAAESPALWLFFFAGVLAALLCGCTSAPQTIGRDFAAATSMTPVVQMGHSAPVVAVAFGPDGKTALSAGSNGQILAWETDTGRELRTLFYEEQRPVSGMLYNEVHRIRLIHQVDVIAFSPNGLMVATSGSEGRVTIWDTSTSRVLVRLPTRDERVSAMAFAPDSRTLLTAGIAGTLTLWDLPSGRPIRSFRNGSFHAQDLSFSEDGRLVLATCADGSCTLWDASEGRAVGTIEAASIRAAALMPGGRRAVCGCTDGTILLWDASSGLTPIVPQGSPTEITCVAASPDGRTALAGGLDGSLTVVDMQQGTRILSVPAHEGGVNAVAFSRDGRYLLSGGKDRTIKLWHRKQTALVRSFRGTALPVRSVNFSPDGRLVATGAGREVHVWDLEKGERFRSFRGHADEVTSVVFSPDGRRIYSTDRCGVTRVGEVSTGRVLPPDHEVPPVKNDSAAHFPDRDLYLSIRHEGTITKRDGKTGNLIGALQCDSGYVSSMVVSPCGRYVLTGGLNGLLKTHSMSGSVFFSLPRSFEGHRGEVHSLAFSPDGTRILSGSEDRTTRLWDTRTGEEIVRMVASEDGEWIMSTPDGYYNNSPEGSGLIHYLAPGGDETFSFEQFESRFKRPDLLQERLQGHLDAGKTVPVLTRPPSLAMKNEGVLVDVGERSVPLDLHVSSEGLVKTVRVFVNGKPVKEIPVGEKEKEIALRVPVFSSANRITALAYDEKGFTSNPAYMDVRCNDPGLDKPDLHVLAVGVNRYPKLAPEYQLEFAHSDANTLAAALKAQEGRLFEKVRTHVLTDEEVTVPAVTGILETWMRIPSTDLVVLFLAGHGVRDSDGTFYFLTSEGTLDHPETGGLSWDILNKHLQENRGRVALLLDACHSGGIVHETVVPNDELAHRFFSRNYSGGGPLTCPRSTRGQVVGA